jgi:hypothetical protein
MPRKAPKEIIEHRITLGNYERDRIDELLTSYQARSVAKSATDLLSSISFPMLGVAALIWVGFSLDEFIEEAKGQFQSFTSKISDWLVDPDGAGVVNYTADELGRAIIVTREEKAALYEESKRFYEQNPQGGYGSAEGKNYRRRIKALDDRERILEKMLDDIVNERGAVSGYLIGGSDKLQKQRLQEYYEEYGGEGQIDWQLGN